MLVFGKSRACTVLHGPGELFGFRGRSVLVQITGGGLGERRTSALPLVFCLLSINAF